MKYIYFILFSIIEYFSIFLLGVYLFRIKLNLARVKKILLSSLLLSSFSLILTIFDLTSIAPFLQILIYTLLLKASLEREWSHATLVSITSYVFYGLIQISLIKILTFAQIVSVSDIAAFTFKGYLIQLICFFIIVATVFTLKITNEGYSFDLDEPFGLIKKYTKKFILFIIILIFLVSTGAFVLYSVEKYNGYVFNLMFTVLLFSTGTLLYFAYKRDLEENEEGGNIDEKISG
ncbi:hypothetical protein EBB07_28880 [Paenibacillaceae bacterium]|nr:hypothetical protein EBB07_28880 [Paenibacillaceae bacterium]